MSTGQANTAWVIGKALGAELLDTAAEVAELEARLAVLRQAEAVRDASRLGQVAAAVRDGKRSVRGSVRAPRRLLAALRAVSVPETSVGSRVVPETPTMALAPAAASDTMMSLDPASYPRGLFTSRGSRVLFSRGPRGVLVAFSCAGSGFRYHAFGGAIPVQQVSRDGAFVEMRFDASVKSGGGFGVNVSWVAEDGSAIPGTTFFEGDVLHRVPVPPGAVELRLVLTLKGDGVALVRGIQLSATSAASAGVESHVAEPLPSGGPAPDTEVVAAPEAHEGRRVQFSVVVPLYNVAAYVGDLLSSLGSQQRGPFGLEVVFVDDGSTDATPEIVAEWVAETAPAVGITARLERQANAGPSVAKNRGIALATGEYVTFVDGDDLMDETYFRDVAEFLIAADEPVPMVDAPIARWHESSPLESASTMLPQKYTAGTRRVDLLDEPRTIKTHAASAFFRLDLVREHELEFPTGIHASEDMLFCAHFLASLPVPQLGVVAGGRYLYRRRDADGQLSSSVWDRPDWLVDKLKDGYLPLLSGLAADGTVPDWLASFVIYDYNWLLGRLGTPAVRDWPLATRQQVVDLVRDGLQFISHESIDDYAAAPLPRGHRLKLHLLKNRAWRPAVLAEGE